MYEKIKPPSACPPSLFQMVGSNGPREPIKLGRTNLQQVQCREFSKPINQPQAHFMKESACNNSQSMKIISFSNPEGDPAAIGRPGSQPKLRGIRLTPSQPRDVSPWMHPIGEEAKTTNAVRRRFCAEEDEKVREKVGNILGINNSVPGEGYCKKSMVRCNSDLVGFPNENTKGQVQQPHFVNGFPQNTNLGFEPLQTGQSTKCVNHFKN
jgi:hypothetical protein